MPPGRTQEERAAHMSSFYVSHKILNFSQKGMKAHERWSNKAKSTYTSAQMARNLRQIFVAQADCLSEQKQEGCPSWRVFNPAILLGIWYLSFGLSRLARTWNSASNL